MANGRNLIFIFADQWRAGAMGFAGEDPVYTPNMDRFCEESTYCDHAFSTFPVCSPHRASLMTGKYPLSAGFYTNCKRGLPLRLRDEELCIAQVLKGQGYRTAYIGKWHLDEPEQNHCPAPASGARDWDAYTPPGIRRHGFDYWCSYGTFDHHLSPHYWRDDDKMICPGKWSPEYETDEVISYLEKQGKDERPFALYLSWNPPHSIYSEVPERYLKQYDDVALKKNISLTGLHHHTGERSEMSEEELRLTTRQYYAAITGLDEQFGRILRFLRESGLYEKSIVVLSADHGDMMGSHGLMGKHVWYEEAIRIPLVIHIPENRKERCRTCIGSQDIMPTVLSLLDIPVPDTVEGGDLSRYLTEELEDRERVCFLCACPGRLELVEEFAREGLRPQDFGWRGIRTQDYTYIMELGYHPGEKARRHLYDLRKHPLAEREESEEERRDLMKELEGQVMDWLRRQQDGFYKSWETACDSL